MEFPKIERGKMATDRQYTLQLVGNWFSDSIDQDNGTDSNSSDGNEKIMVNALGHVTNSITIHELFMRLQLTNQYSKFLSLSQDISRELAEKIEMKSIKIYDISFFTNDFRFILDKNEEYAFEFAAEQGKFTLIEILHSRTITSEKYWNIIERLGTPENKQPKGLLLEIRQDTQFELRVYQYSKKT